MRRLLNTLYVLQEDSYLSLKNENIIIHYSDDRKQAVPLIGLEEIFIFSYKGASPELIGACVEKGIGLTFLTPQGRFLARPSGRAHGNVLLRKSQYRISDDEDKSCLIARHMTMGKIYNCRRQVERTRRDHALRVDSEKLLLCSSNLKTAYETALNKHFFDRITK